MTKDTKDNLEQKAENPNQPYNFIILLGPDHEPLVAEKIRNHLKAKELESGGKFKGKLLVSDEKGLGALLKEESVKSSLKQSNDKTLVEVFTHGINVTKDESRTHYTSTGSMNDVLSNIKEIIPDVKHVKLVACHVGTNSRSNNKGEEQGQVYKSLTQNMVVYENGDSKYSANVDYDLDQTIKSIDLICEGVMQDNPLTNEREEIISALRNPLSMNINNGGVSHKLSRLFRDTPKDENGYIVKEGGINEVMQQFVNQRAAQLKEIFPDHKELIDELVKTELNNGLIENLKNDALPMYATRGSSEGNLLVIKALAKSGINLNTISPGGASSLYIAWAMNDEKMVDTLLESGADPIATYNQKNKMNIGYDYFLRNSESAKATMEAGKIIPDSKTLSRWVIEGNVELVRLALANPAVNPNVQDRDGDSLLAQACWSSNLEMINLILHNDRTDPNIANDKGKTPLFMAVGNGDFKMAQAILSNDKTKIIPDKEKKMPHMVAFNNKNYDIALLIVLKTGQYDMIPSLMYKIETSTKLAGSPKIDEGLINDLKPLQDYLAASGGFLSRHDDEVKFKKEFNKLCHDLADKTLKKPEKQIPQESVLESKTQIAEKKPEESAKLSPISETPSSSPENSREDKFLPLVPREEKSI